MVLRGSVSGWRRLPAGILKEMSEPAGGQGGREALIIHDLKTLNYIFSIRSKIVVQNTVVASSTQSCTFTIQKGISK